MRSRLKNKYNKKRSYGNWDKYKNKEFLWVKLLPKQNRTS